MKLIVYALQDPRDFVIRYIGMSSSPRQRLKEHCNLKSTGNGNKQKKEWIKDLKANNLKPTLLILEDASLHENPYSREDFYMTAHKTTIFNIQASRYSSGNFKPKSKREAYFLRDMAQWKKDHSRSIEVTFPDNHIEVFPSITAASITLNIKTKRLAEQLQGYKSSGHGVIKKVYSYRGMSFKYKV